MAGEVTLVYEDETVQAEHLNTAESDERSRKGRGGRLVMLLFEGGARTAEDFREGLRRMG
jgi:hypothetical protein